MCNTGIVCTLNRISCTVDDEANFSPVMKPKKQENFMVIKYVVIGDSILTLAGHCG